MTFLDRMAETKRLWSVVLPNIELPQDATLVRWLAASPDRDIEKAILQVLGRYKNKQPETPQAAHRLVTSVLTKYRDRRRQQERIQQQQAQQI
jgi:hypothetical protein